METMYCYKLDEKGIHKYKITDYTTYTDGFRRQTYSIFACLGAKTQNYHNVKFKNIDKFHQGFLFTFTLTDEEAKDIIIKATKDRLDKARREAERIGQLFDKANEYLQ